MRHERMPHANRRSFFVILTVLYYLLAFTTSAHAECAWVLWQLVDSMTIREVEGPTPRTSYKTAEECIRRIDDEYRTVGTWQSAWGRSAPTEATVMSNLGGSAFLVTYTCLPDTVDPRGPKGK